MEKSMNPKGLMVSMIFEAESANYGEEVECCPLKKWQEEIGSILIKTGIDITLSS